MLMLSVVRTLLLLRRTILMRSAGLHVKDRTERGEPRVSSATAGVRGVEGAVGGAAVMLALSPK